MYLLTPALPDSSGGCSAEHMDECGFVVVPDVIGPAEIESLLRSLSSDGVRRSRAGARHLLRHPVVSALTHSPALLSLAGHFLQSEAHPFRVTLFDKSMTANWAVVWHQDTALPLRSRHDEPGWGPWSVKEGVVYAHAPTEALRGIVALRVHLDDSTEENGPLRVLPGTHRRGVLPDAEVAALARTIAPHACVVGRGGVLAMSPMLIHASSKVASPTPRRVLHIEYARSLHLAGGVELALA